LLIRERRRQVVAAVPSVRDRLFEEQFVRAEIVDPQSPGGRGPGEIDDGERRGIRVAAFDGDSRRLEGNGEDFRVDPAEVGLAP
jgi:hypothetical protein